MNNFEFYLYIVTVVIMIATPGPVMNLVASAGLNRGYHKAFQTIVGTNLASLVLITASILMLKGMFTIHETFFLIIKILGCFYIAYLGYQILKDACSESAHQQIAIRSSVAGGFKKGFFVGISNPKDILFFSSFFPQFIQIHSNLNISLAILVITWIILDFLTLSMVYLTFHQLSKSQIYPKILALCGSVLIMIAIYGVYITLQRQI